jgi:hypothetical protein
MIISLYDHIDVDAKKGTRVFIPEGEGGCFAWLGENDERSGVFERR